MIMKKNTVMKLENYNVVELNALELEAVNAGGAIGRVIGWVTGFIMRPGASDETLMNCI